MVLDRVVLTGASGMLGAHALALLARHGARCLCLCRTRPDPLPPGSGWAAWDLTEPLDATRLDALCARPDALIHLGAATSAPPGGEAALLAANVRASADLADWARERGVPMAYVSGAVVYADPWRENIRENDPLLDAPGFGGVYGWSKLQGELAVAAQAARGLRALVLRPSSIYGLKIAKEKLVWRFLQRAMAGETLTVSPPAGDRVDFVHAADVAAALLDGLSAGAWGVYNVGGALATMRQLAQACVAVAGKGRILVPEDDGPHAGDPGRTRFGLDCAVAGAAFGYGARIGLERGLALMARNHYLPGREHP